MQNEKAREILIGTFPMITNGIAAGMIQGLTLAKLQSSPMISSYIGDVDWDDLAKKIASIKA
jgi:hypothetical protein